MEEWIECSNCTKITAVVFVNIIEHMRLCPSCAKGYNRREKR